MRVVASINKDLKKLGRAYLQFLNVRFVPKVEVQQNIRMAELGRNLSAIH